MKSIIMTLGLVTLLSAGALSQENGRQGQYLRDLFDRGLPAKINDLVYRPAEAPAVVVPIQAGEATIQIEPYFTVLELSLKDPWSGSHSMLTIKEDGQATLKNESPNAKYRLLEAKLDADEMQEIGQLWQAARLPAGRAQIGRPIMDVTTFTLSYDLCSSRPAINLCDKGSVRGWLPSSYEPEYPNLRKLLDKLQSIENRLRK